MVATKHKRITDRLSVSGQINTQDLYALPALGITTVVNNRPDSEEPGQPQSAELARAVRTLGLNYYHIPVTPGRLDPKDAARMRAVICAAQGRVLAFCRTGNRSAQLYELGQGLR